MKVAIPHSLLSLRRNLNRSLHLPFERKYNKIYLILYFLIAFYNKSKTTVLELLKSNQQSQNQLQPVEEILKKIVTPEKPKKRQTKMWSKSLKNCISIDGGVANQASVRFVSAQMKKCKTFEERNLISQMINLQWIIT